MSTLREFLEHRTKKQAAHKTKSLKARRGARMSRFIQLTGKEAKLFTSNSEDGKIFRNRLTSIAGGMANEWGKTVEVSYPNGVTRIDPSDES
jgi:hypothetical protein